MKILHLSSYFITDFFYENIFKKQRENGHEVDVFVHKQLHQSDGYARGEYVCSPYKKHHKFLFTRKHNLIFKHLDDFYKKDYDIVHAHSLFSNGMQALKLLEKYGVPYVVAVRSTDLNVFFKYFLHLRKLGIEILRNASRIVFISKSCKNDLFRKYIKNYDREEFEKKSYIITNGVNDFWLDNVYDNFSSDGESINIINVGKVNKNKNQIVICKALSLLSEKGLTVNLKCVGKIECSKTYKKLSKYDFVEHIDFVSKEELINYYRTSDIFVLLSIKETFGISYLEAMSQCLPVLYTENQGFDKIFNDGYIGYSLKHNDFKKLSEIIESIFTDKMKYKYFSENCKASINKFSWDVIVKGYDELYKESLVKV